MACCCGNTTRAIVANSAVTAPTTSPVTLTVDRALPVGCCFDICICKGQLVNASTNPVSVTDGTTTYEVYTQCADLVRYDQLICKGKAGCSRMAVDETLRLKASVRADAETPRLLILTDLPASSYAPAGATGGGGGAA